MTNKLLEFLERQQQAIAEEVDRVQAAYGSSRWFKWYYKKQLKARENYQGLFDQQVNLLKNSSGFTKLTSMIEHPNCDYLQLQQTVNKFIGKSHLSLRNFYSEKTAFYNFGYSWVNKQRQILKNHAGDKIYETVASVIDKQAEVYQSQLILDNTKPNLDSVRLSTYKQHIRNLSNITGHLSRLAKGLKTVISVLSDTSTRLSQLEPVIKTRLNTRREQEIKDKDKQLQAALENAETAQQHAERHYQQQQAEITSSSKQSISQYSDNFNIFMAQQAKLWNQKLDSAENKLNSIEQARSNVQQALAAHQKKAAGISSEIKQLTAENLELKAQLETSEKKTHLLEQIIYLTNGINGWRTEIATHLAQNANTFKPGYLKIFERESSATFSVFKELHTADFEDLKQIDILLRNPLLRELNELMKCLALQKIYTGENLRAYKAAKDKGDEIATTDKLSLVKQQYQIACGLPKMLVELIIKLKDIGLNDTKIQVINTEDENKNGPMLKMACKGLCDIRTMRDIVSQDQVKQNSWNLAI